MNTFIEIESQLAQHGFTLERKDLKRPWGGFFVLEEQHASNFYKRYFPDLKLDVELTDTKVSPKILAVAPHKRLSWQYHYRRAEIWRVVRGPVAVAKSDTDEQSEPDIYQDGDVIRLECGERHRLIGLENWGIVAEIWVHQDKENPSDEDDIVRLQDDFKRS